MDAVVRVWGDLGKTVRRWPGFPVELAKHFVCQIGSGDIDAGRPFALTLDFMGKTPAQALRGR